MKNFTVYRQTVKSIHLASDIINRVGWEGVKDCDNTSAKLKLATQCLFDEEVSESVKDLIALSLQTNVLLPVAEVECESLDDAYEQTNTISRLWIENASVTIIHQPEDIFFSSTSAGDIFKDNETNEVFITLGIGFAQIA